MRKPIATLTISGLIFAISSIASTPAVFAQGLLKRLQDRVQSLDEQNSADQIPAARTPVESGPPVGGSRTNPRRPLVDAFLQYGPEIFGGQGNNNPADGQPGSVSGHATLARPAAQFSKASMGIDVLDSPPGVPGVLVTGFRSDSQADDAGLQKDDVIVSLDQTLTPKIADIARFLSLRRAGETVSARVLRGDQMKTIRIPLLGSQSPSVAANQQQGAAVPLAPLPRPPATLAPASKSVAVESSVQERRVSETLSAAGQVESLPAPTNQPATQLTSDNVVGRYGILLGPDSRLRGAWVDGVINGSAAESSGIKPADRVVSVNGLLTQDNTAFVRQINHLPQGTMASLGVVRANAYVIKRMMLTTELKSGAAVVGDQQNASSTQQSADGKGMERENGVLQGIGSVLGGLLGGAGKPPGKGQFEVAPQVRKKGPETSEPVRQTSLEQNLSGQLKEMLGDPPSLDGLLVKPRPGTRQSTNDSEKSEQTAAEMREQIRQLQEKLKRIEQGSQSSTQQSSQSEGRVDQQDTPATTSPE